MRVFKPFGWDSWGLIVLSLILTGVVYWVLEFDAPEGEKQFEHTISGGIASVRETFQGFVEYGIVGFAPGTTGGKIVACGFGFFLLILHSTYTANLAAILNNLQQQADLESLEGAENQPYSICIARTSGAGMREMYQKVNWAHDPRDCQCCQEVVVDGVLLKYDEATETYDSGYCQNKRTCEEGESCAAGILEREDILPLVESGHCKAAVMAKQDLIVEQAEGRYCGMKAVGNGLEMVYRGFPVRAEIAAAVRHYIVQSRGDGTLGNIFLDNDPTGDDRKYMDSKYEGEAMPPMCEINDGEEETDSDDEANMSLDMVKMSGAFIWLGGTLVISVFVNLCQICIRRGKARTPDHGNKLEHVSLQGIKRMLMGRKGPSRARASGWVGGRNGMSMASLQGLPEEQAEAVLDEMSVKMDEHLQETEEKIQAAINQALDSKLGALVSAMGGDASKLNGGSNGGGNGGGTPFDRKTFQASTHKAPASSSNPAVKFVEADAVVVGEPSGGETRRKHRHRHRRQASDHRPHTENLSGLGPGK